MFQIWNDEFLVWDPEEFDGITEISLSSDAIWVPDVIISELYVHDRCISPACITSSFCVLEMNFVELYSHCIILSSYLSSVDVGKSPVIPYVYVNCSGTVKNYKPIQVVSACHLEIYAFPFDKQNCTLTFRSWLHSGKLLTRTQRVLCTQAGLRIMRVAVITECF